MWSSAIHSEHSEREKVREHLTHKSKLHKIKPRIDNKPPRILLHLKNKTKKNFQHKERQKEITSHNKILLSKLLKISKEFTVADHKVMDKRKSFKKVQADRKIAVENEGIVKRIRSTKSYYSHVQQDKDYKKQRYFIQMLSENARRVPRTTNYANPSELDTRSSRPKSAATIVSR